MRCLLFDFDGVIVDSLKISHQSSMEVLGKVIALATYRTFFHGNVHDHEDVAKNNNHPEKKITEDHPFYQRYIPRLMMLSPIEEVHALIPELAKSFTLFVVTSTTTKIVESFLEKHGIGSCFEEVLGADLHTSKAVKIQGIMDRHQISPKDCVLITDTLGDIREGASVGVQSIAVTWGFHEREDLEKGSPFAIVQSAEELDQTIRKYLV